VRSAGLDHHSSGHAELSGQRPPRRQRGAGVQPARAHAVAQLLLELRAQRTPVGAVEGDEEVAAEVVDAVHGILIIQWTSQR